MSLYLTVFKGGEEVEGWVLGAYSTFGCFRDTVDRLLGSSDYPTLMDHSDCDGEWAIAEIPTLISELKAIGDAFRGLPPEEPVEGFEHTAEYRRGAKTLYECFHNVDGENLFDAMRGLCEVALAAQRPILFQ